MAHRARCITKEEDMDHRQPRVSSSAMTRRATLESTGALVATLGLGRGASPAHAQDANLAEHPMAGTWLAMANPPLPDDPQVAAPSLFGVDGTVLLLFPVTQRGPQGPVFNSAGVGTWEPDGERRAHFTAVQVLSDADGRFLGTVTIDGYPEASEDGRSFIDDGSRVVVTIRDTKGTIVDQVVPTGQPAGRPVTGVRMGVGSPGFPGGTPTAGTPTA
jgi:hypothetical protein